jgi:hypothetical protein
VVHKFEYILQRFGIFSSGGLAQMVERLLCMLQVKGSMPLSSTFFFLFTSCFEVLKNGSIFFDFLAFFFDFEMKQL